MVEFDWIAEGAPKRMREAYELSQICPEFCDICNFYRC